MMRRRPNLLLLGASGGVARAFLRKLPAQRHRFGSLVLLDKSASVRSNPYLDHRALKYTFFHEPVRVPEDEARYRRILKTHRINLVLDLTDQDTMPILHATDAAGASYLNTGLSDGKKEATALVADLLPGRLRRWKAPHVLCAGMNPGIVNLWVVYGMQRFGKPRNVVHFEYDTSTFADGWRPSITWSKKEFLAETVWDASGVVLRDGVKILKPNGLAHREDLGPVMKPVWSFPRYPEGFTILHEENITLGRRHGVPSRFVYAIHPRTMDHLMKVWKAKKTVKESDLELADNLRKPLSGADHIGVCLDYGRRRVYYTNVLPNSAVNGTNATCTQVATGVYCALFTLMYDPLHPMLYLVGDFLRNSYRYLLFDNMRVEEHVFDRRGGRWILRKHVPAVRLPPGRGQKRILF